MFDIVDSNDELEAVIKVIGVGGGGGNAVNHMKTSDVEGVEFICANTDAQALKKVEVENIIQLGGDTTKGLGAGANPNVGRDAAQHDRERIANALAGTDMVFIAAGMGGGTGTGGAPVVAEIARDMGILTVAVVTSPFKFEGKKRSGVAMDGINRLKENVDSLIIIPNDKLLHVLGKDTPLSQAFDVANTVLKDAVQGITDLITRPGQINVDFADVQAVMSVEGLAMMGTGQANGEGRAVKAATAAIENQLLEDVDLSGAKGLLVNVTCGFDLTLGEFHEVGETIHEYASEDATVVIGSVLDPEMDGDLMVTVVATGLREKQNAEVPKSTAPELQTVKGTAKTPRGGEQLDLSQSVLGEAGRKSAQPTRTRPVRSGSAVRDIDMVDVPTFLRRAAD
ncbi:MAG: cell division protein FtsZ [Pontibacterium sp.]